MKPVTSTIFNIRDEVSFKEKALELFHYQANHNKVYASYLQNLRIHPDEVNELTRIPFIPIEFFKSHQLITGDEESREVFTSSGTTGMTQSKHYVTDVKLYEESYLRAFEQFYGNVEDYCILALLPSYLERNGSSLIYMADDLIRRSNHPDSGFYLHNYDELLVKLKQLENKNQQTILLGVTYSLLDIAELYVSGNYPPLQHTIIMETGGMKGKRKEMIREDLHHRLCSSFGVTSIHSEYGMTELLSQAYSKGMGRFKCPPWM
ncbi:MAG TPA: acyl transferase, partial [Bacteroidia bacterium]|nr:acyl transferase [Bacteroidia bacterium]